MFERNNITFSDNDIFDGNKIEVVNGRAQLKLVLGLYPTDNPTIETAVALNVETIGGFLPTETKPAGTEIEYALRDGDDLKYWDGDDFVISDGIYAQANLGTEIDDNRQKITFTNGMKIVCFLHSDDGSATPIL